MRECDGGVAATHPPSRRGPGEEGRQSRGRGIWRHRPRSSGPHATDMGQTLYRVGLGVTLLLVAVACTAPFRETVEANGFTPEQSITGDGLRLAELGWLGPFEASVAWYANILLTFGAVRMLRGRPPPLLTSLIAFCLALTAFLPHVVYAGGWHLAYFEGEAVWIWLSAYAINAALAVHGEPVDH
jgi:hypothetical protein